MKPIIPKSPEVPKEFSDKEISFLTKSVFGEIIEPQPCDVLFVFSGTHPGHWEKAIEAYQKDYVRRIIVTGGRSLTGTPHPDWNGHTEAEVIIQHLLAAGIPEEAIKSENSSSNTLENTRLVGNGGPWLSTYRSIFVTSHIPSMPFIRMLRLVGIAG